MQQKKCFDDQWIVVTGALGLIGSSVIRHLNDLGYDRNLIAVDDFKESIKWKNLRGKRYNEFLSRYELMDWLKREGERVEAIIHLGANSSTTGTNGCDYYRLNYRYSVDLAEKALDLGVRFIYASSAATYGGGERGFIDDHENLHQLMPLNMYGYSKHMFDLWALENGYLDHMVGLKYFNVYGPNEYHKGRMASMVYHMYHQIMEKEKVSLFASNSKEFQDGEQKRDFIYVKDVAKLTCSFLSNDLMGIYNIGTGKASSWNALAKALFKAMGKKEEIVYIPMPQDIAKTYQNYTEADMTKLHKDLPCSYTTLEKGVSDYVTYLQKDERW